MVRLVEIFSKSGKTKYFGVVTPQGNVIRCASKKDAIQLCNDINNTNYEIYNEVHRIQSDRSNQESEIYTEGDGGDYRRCECFVVVQNDTFVSSSEIVDTEPAFDVQAARVLDKTLEKLLDENAKVNTRLEESSAISLETAKIRRRNAEIHGRNAEIHGRNAEIHGKNAGKLGDAIDILTGSLRSHDDSTTRKISDTQTNISNFDGETFDI